MPLPLRARSWLVALLALGAGALQEPRCPAPRRRGVALRAGAFVPVGAIRAGEVTRIESYGCFVRLKDGGASGLVHVSEVARERVRHPEEVVAVGQPVFVKVLAPREPGRTSFSLRAVDQRSGTACPATSPSATSPSTRLSLDDCALSFSRSSGAGGQHVNKVSTKCELRFNVDRDGALPMAVRVALRARHASRLTKTGDLLVVSETHRSQRRNAEDALSRLQAFVDAAAAAAAPRATRPDKKRRIKGLARGSERKRKDGKMRASAKKAARRRVTD